MPALPAGRGSSGGNGRSPAPSREAPACAALPFTSGTHEIAAATHAADSTGMKPTAPR